METLSDFSDNLAELINEHKLSVEQFAEIVGITYSEIYRYLRKEYIPKLSNVIKIADAFGYSVDYLLGFIPFPENVVYKITPEFSVRFRQLLTEKNITRYMINKNTGIPINRLDDWYNGKFTPSIDKAVKLAKYFNCSIDYLLGRE